MPKAIGIERSDGSIEAVCVHGDGMGEAVIEVAARHYRNDEAVSALIALGDLSMIGRSIGEQHDFDSAHCAWGTPEWCLAYHRDREEPWEQTKPHTFQSRAEYTNRSGRLGVDRVYLFDAKAEEWLWFGRQKWQPVGPLADTCTRD